MARAIILAAGHGDQAAENNPGDHPLCLAEYEGVSLLARQLDQLYRNGVRSADLVVGLQAREVIDHVATLESRPDVAFHFNPRYEQSSMLNLLAARETLVSGEAVLLIDGQLLCHPGILAHFVQSGMENGFVLDRDAARSADTMKLVLHDGRIVEFCRELPAGLEHDEMARPLGLFKLDATLAASLEKECARCEAEGLSDVPYETILRRLLLSCPLAFGFEDITGLPWRRVDRLEDITGFQVEAGAVDRD